ncbi:leucyl aminopeptidase [Fodinicurvata sp. EGI_FJ10296]|uniref:leucyl aminopeptidase n=1 Tax=Fodinicurvata sp. EGI_FJ10296 TaxID=3231908 RepID=UPI003454ACB7
MKVAFADPIAFDSKEIARDGVVVVVGVMAEGVLTPAAKALDDAVGGAVSAALNGVARFSGKAEETLWLPFAGDGGPRAVLLAGLGSGKDIDAGRCQKIGAAIRAALGSSKATDATIAFDLPDAGEQDAPDTPGLAANLGFGLYLRSYRFDKYKAAPKDDEKPTLGAVTIAVDRKSAAKKAYGALQKVAEGVNLTRDLVSEPANELYPEVFAQRCQELEKSGLTVEVIEEKKLRKLGMGALLAVNEGSQREARVVVMSWNGGKAKEAPIAFVGKGVTFDTGGISIKPAAGMEDMKWDMGGAGVVTGLMKALAGRKARVNAVGIIGLVENMPSGSAMRPGDIVRSMSGKTIEVLNTDAEGRLVLADILHYAQDRFKPAAMVNLATLTGAIIVALGEDQAGLFSNNDDLRDKLLAASKAVDEPLWAMPLGEGFDRQLDSDAADVKNIGQGRFGGASVAGQFLKRFVADDVAWAHIDIAGVTWSKKDRATNPRGATGFGVRLLDRLVADHYENQ